MRKESRKDWFKNFFIGQWHTLKESFIKDFIKPKKSEVLLSILWVVIGNLILALGASIFLVPGNIITGGTSGIALIIAGFYEMATGVPLDTVFNINHVITICTIFFFVLGYFLLGFSFTLKTAISTIVYPLGVYLFDFLRQIITIDGKKMLMLETYMENESYSPGIVMMMAGIFGGILMGAGVAFSFKGGGSTGGVDCIIMWAHKKFGIPTAIASFITDFSTLILGFFAVKDFMQILFGLIAVILCTITIDRITTGMEESYVAEIVSSKWKEISDEINSEMERGTTLYYAQGGYTGIERKVVKVSFSRNEYRDLLRIIKAHDKYAFVMVSEVKEIQGNGFSYDDGDEPLRLSSKHSLKDIEKIKAQHRKEETKLIEQKEKEMRIDLMRVRKEEKRQSKK